MCAWKTRAIATTLLILASASSLAMGVVPSEWPLERILANLEARLRQSPEDAQALYNLGRAHAFAFVLKRSSLWVYDPPSPRHVTPNRGTLLITDLDKQDRKRWPSDAGDPGFEPPAPGPAELLHHLSEGVLNLRRACAREPKEGRFHLTLAWLLEAGAASAELTDTPGLFELRVSNVPPEKSSAIQTWVFDLGSRDQTVVATARTRLLLPENLEQAVSQASSALASSAPQMQRACADFLRRYWIERAIQEYAQAFSLSFEADLMDDFNAPHDAEELHHMVSYEALEGYRRLVQDRGVLGPDEEQRLKELAANQKQLDARPLATWVTPLVVSLDGCRSLEELITPNLVVPYDLDGDGVDELWPWIAPDAGWLVWDPEQQGEITSGRQLFGSASAWLFFEDGYRALDALDDDRDGALRGAELAGIAVWFDRDTDGVSDRGEVVPVEDLGIVALSTQSTLTVGRSPANLCGAELADGRVLPTYDWVLEPAARP